MIELPPGTRIAIDRPVVDAYRTQEAAEHAIAYLADHDFPAERTAIVGTGLHAVAPVRGALTRFTAAVVGAITGLWLGGVAGLFVVMFAAGHHSALAAIGGGALYGGLLGGVFGMIAFVIGAERRDRRTPAGVVADRYYLLADADVADEARRLLGKLAEERAEAARSQA